MHCIDFFNSCVNTLINNNASLILLILYVDYIKRVTGITTDELVAVSQDHDSNNGTATKQFLIT